MAQNSFALLTNLGRAKEAAALANGTAIVITHIAIGDGTTVPSGGETTLYNEVARKAISGHGTVIGASNVAYFDIFLAAADGPYTIREAGLYDNAGDLIAIARYDPPISKPVPSSGQTVEGTVRLQVAFSNIANVTIVVDPSFTVPLQRLSRLPWVPVLSMSVSAPPSSPTLGDAYLIPAGSTGSWAGQSGKIAEYTSAGWGILTPPDGHGISLPDGRVFEKIGGDYVEKLALDTQSGKWNYAIAGGSANALEVALNPSPAALTDGMVIRVKVTTTNTGSATFRVNGSNPIVIQRPGGGGILPGDLPKNAIVDFIKVPGSWQISAAAIAPQIYFFSEPGTVNWICPPYVTRAHVKVWGAGGGGGGGIGGVTGGSAGSGGGGGGYSEGVVFLNPGQSYPITTGSAGLPGASNSNGSSGGGSSFGSLLSATGGGGGFYSGGGGQSTVGGGGFGTGGQFQSSGQTGGRGQTVAGVGFVGNGGGSYSSSGASASFSLGGGTGSTPGGGGSGGADGIGGGSGGRGFVIIQTF